ncbi:MULTISPECIES: SMI1/KNR4 family protein [unclassified Psychrobacter]|uniref:SMI1/KNR4 family protein n=1 Tax=unclassified Psychrobacter TaxID=196806 RepID=UPI001D0C2F6D|nr:MULTISPECIES: SMI1/KNR4 family protein [unclassified Psychrobacter]
MFIEILAQYPRCFDTRNISGCNEKQINDLQKKFNVEFPEDYKNFLREMGTNPGNFMAGTDLTYYELDDIQEGLIDIFKYNKIDIDEKNVFCVMLHQGYVADFFFKSGNGTTMFYITEGEDNYFKTADNFMKLFLGKVQFELDMRKQYNNFKSK